MQKRKTFRPWQPEQTTLLPPSPREWLSEDHQVYFLLDLVDELDLSQILIPAQAKDPRGEKGFDPRMLTLLLLYAYCVGIVSSRKIERACYEDLAFRVLTGNQQPDHSRISEFRRRNLDALKGLFVQILRLCQKAGMVRLGHVALDGTKVQANASKHKAMSHERMLRAEKELDKEINALMRKAEILDAQEDHRYGKGNRGSELPDELRHQQSRLARIRQARKEMEAETAAAAARQRQEEAAPSARKADGTPTKKSQRNFTDPDSHLMQSGGTYLQGYNCQVAVDSSGHQVIVAVGVSNQPPDVEHLEPMLQRIADGAGAMPEVMTMDAGYWGEDNAKTWPIRGLTPTSPLAGCRTGSRHRRNAGPMPRNADAKTRMARKLRSRREEDLHPAQGDRRAGERADQGSRGLWRFLLRGLEKVNGEWDDGCHAQPAVAGGFSKGVVAPVHATQKALAVVAG